MTAFRSFLLGNSSVFQVIPWKSFLIAVNDVSPASQVFVCFFLICEEHINTFFQCYRHAIKFPAFEESCACQHTQRTGKSWLVENLFEAAAILEVTSKSGGIPFSVLFPFSRFGHEDLIGLGESLLCIPGGKCLVLSVNAIRIVVVGYGHTNFRSFFLMFSCWHLLKHASSPTFPPPGPIFLLQQLSFSFLLSADIHKPIPFTRRKTGFLQCCYQVINQTASLKTFFANTPESPRGLY